MTEPTPPTHDFAGTLTCEEFACIQQRLLPVWARSYVLYPMMAAVFLFFMLRDGPTVITVGVDLVVLAILSIAMVVTMKRVRDRSWRQAVRMVGRVHGTISRAGIVWNTARSTARYEWEQIARVEQTEGLTLAIFPSRSAFYFPRSFFASDAAWTAFNEAIRGYVRAAGGRTPSPR